MYDITSGRSFTYYGFWVLFSTFILLNIYMFVQEQSGYVALVQPPPQIDQFHTNVSGDLTKNSKGPPEFPKKYISDEAVSAIVANTRNKFSSKSRWTYFQSLFFQNFLIDSRYLYFIVSLLSVLWWSQVGEVDQHWQESFWIHFQDHFIPMNHCHCLASIAFTTAANMSRALSMW